ncbi:MAG TPA: hypothetical protein VGP72_11760 [Planctomycetota bacterium]|jgi:hypothetical protein
MKSHGVNTANSPRSLRLCVQLVVLVACAVTAGETPVKIEPIEEIGEGTKGYSVTTPLYKVKLNADGRLQSLLLGQTELLDGGILLGMGGQHEKPDFVKLLDAQTMQLNFPSRPVAKYTFEANGFNIWIKNQKKNWDFGLYYTLSAQAQTATSTGRGFKDLALPFLQGRTAYDDVEYLFSDGSVMSVTQKGPGNHINADENGSIANYTWGRKCLEVNGEYTYTFLFKKGAPGTKKLSAPPFIIKPERRGSIYTTGEQAAFTLEFKKAHYQKVLGIEGLIVECSTRDMWGQRVDSAEVPVTFPKDEDPKSKGGASIPVKFQPKRKGWFELSFTLKDKQSTLIPNTMVTALSVLTPAQGLLTPPLPEKAGTYEYNALLGLTCHRESMNLDQVFSQSANTDRPSTPSADLKAGDQATKELALDDKKETEKPAFKPAVAKWDDLDKAFAASLEAQKKYGCTVFWLMDPWPKWLMKEPERFEQALYQVVNRYKDRNKYWMLVNEPNLFMSPQDYVSKYLAPLYRAAKKADPEAKIMGPDTCGLNPGWLEAVYKAGGKMDIIDMHPYTGHHRGWEEHGMTDTWQKVRAAMTANGDGAKEMWSTESGYDWSLGRLGKNHHAKHIVRQYPLAESVGIPKNHFFLYYTCFVGYHKMYLVEQDGSLLPGGVAARVQSEQLAETKYVGPKDSGKDKHAFLYSGKDEDVWQVWSNDCKTTLDVTIGGKKLKVFDMMGNTLDQFSAPGKITLPLSGYPLFVRVDKGATFDPAKENLGPNLARENGVKVTASSEEKPGCAQKIIDGVWTTENTGSFEDRIWQSKKSLKDEKEAWLEIALRAKQPVNRVHVYSCSSVCGMPGLRDFKVLAFDDAKNDWKAVGEVSGSEEAWVFHLTFAPVQTDRIKISITDLNNGFFVEDKRNYTDMKPRVSEVEVYAQK